MQRVTLMELLTCVAALAVAVAACGGSQNPIATQSPSRSPGATPSAAATQKPGAGGGAPSASATTATISALNVKYDKSQLTVPAGAIRIEFDNNDANVTHNFAVYKSSSDTSSPLGATPITSGPDKQTLSITLSSGEYYYQCEVHPTQMNGKLVVR